MSGTKENFCNDSTLVMINNLPFLKPRGWPQKAKIAGESKYGFSEDDELIDTALDELIEAVHSRNHKSAIKAIHALLKCLETQDGEHETDV